MHQPDDDIPNFEFHFDDESLEDFFFNARTQQLVNAEKSRREVTASAAQDAPVKAEMKMKQSERFSTASEADVKSMIAEASNKNTDKTTSTWLRVFREWAVVKQQPAYIETIPPEKLDLVLQQFYAEVKKKNGEDYEPESLAVMQASLDRHLRERNYGYSIVRDDKFCNSNKVLKGKASKLRQLGKGNRPNSSQPLTWEDEEKLWSLGRLGNTTPESLLHTVWFQLTQHLGFRGCQEHKQAEVDDFIFGMDENGSEYIMYDESKPTKTRPGGLRKKKRSQIPRMYATGGERCPVKMFKELLFHRPESMKTSGPLYLSTIKNPQSTVWYKEQGMGKNRIGEIMKRIVENTELATKKLTNHSGRKTVVKKLDDAAVPRSRIMTVTGHRNEKSLDDYVDCMNNDQSKELSSIISGGGTSSGTRSAPLQHRAARPALSDRSNLQEALTCSSAMSENAQTSSSFPNINLANLAQSMSNSTISLTVNNNFYAQHNCTTPATNKVKRRRIQIFDSDSE